MVDSGQESGLGATGALLGQLLLFQGEESLGTWLSCWGPGSLTPQSSYNGHGVPWFVGMGPRPKELGLVTVLCRQWPVALIPVAWQVQATHLHLGERTVLYARNLSHIWDWWGWHQGGNGVREKTFLISQGLGRPRAVPVSLS